MSQPIEIRIAVSEAQPVALFEKIASTETRLFYTKSVGRIRRLGAHSSASRQDFHYGDRQYHAQN